MSVIMMARVTAVVRITVRTTIMVTDMGMATEGMVMGIETGGNPLRMIIEKKPEDPGFFFYAPPLKDM